MYKLLKPIGVLALVALCGAMYWFFQRDPNSRTIAVAAPVRGPQHNPGGSISAARPSAAPATVMDPVAVAVRARNLPASAWATETRPVFSEFRNWTNRYFAASSDERQRLVAEGVELAQNRRTVLAGLIRSDPHSALAAAVPMTVRQELPPEVLALLETRVSGRGELALHAVTPAPGVAVTEPVFRSALIGREEYRAYVYGRRANQTSLAAASIIGIAVDRSLAISDSPLRVLEAGEVAAARPLDLVCSVSGLTASVTPETKLNVTAPVAVEYNGKVQVLCEPDHVAALEDQLVAGEKLYDHHAADNQPGSSSVTGRPTQAWTHGTKKTLVIRVDFSDLPGVPVRTSGAVPITEDVVVNLFNGIDGVRDYYVQGSYGKTSLLVAPTVAGDSPDVTAVLRMPQTAATYAVNDNNDLLHSDARAAAQATGLNVDSYDRIGVVFSSVSSISGSKINYGGLGIVTGKNFWINGQFDFGTVAHEIGHNYGLNHASLWQVTDGNPVSAAGTSVEYGDIFDVMGDGKTIAHSFSHWNKSILQWIPDTAVTLAATSGTFRVYRFDSATPNLANARALKIVRDATRDYWIGYRRGSGNASFNNGAYVLWGYNSNQRGNLLDMTTPGTNVNDAGLAIGATFTDAVAGISFKPVGQGGSGDEEYLDVQVVLQPKVQWSQDVFLVDERVGAAVLTLTRTQNSVGAVSVNYATAAGTAATPADFTTQTGTVTWADGDMAEKTVTIAIVADAVVETTENFTVTLSGATGGVLGNPTATVTVADAGVRDPTFTSNFINNTVRRIVPLPDGSLVLGGFFSSVQDSALTSFNRGGLVRISGTGAIDAAFATAGGAATVPVRDVARQPDGKILVVGDFTTFNGTARVRVARLLPDGTVDSSFATGTGPDGEVYAVLVQPDGKIVIGGAFTNYNGVAREYLARLNADGSLDTGFTGPDFADTSGWRVESLALQPDGKLLVGGTFYLGGSADRSGLCRVGSTGALDATFTGVVEGANALGDPNTLMTVSRIVVQPDGRIVIAGTFTAFNNTARGGLARLSATGALEASFAPVTNGACQAVLLLPDGSLLVGGAFTQFNGAAANRLVRLSAAGVVDSSFIAAGGFGASIEDMVLLPDGRVLFSGDVGAFQGSTVNRPVWRLVAGLAKAPGTVQFASAAVAGGEGSSVTLSVTRTGGGLGTLSVGYSTVPGTATAADFTPSSGVLSWADGDLTAKTISVPLTADGIDEPVETFLVNLGAPLIGGALLGTVQQSVVSIVVLPTISTPPQPATVTAGNAFTFSVTATGTPPPTYQWRKDGIDIPNATNATLTLNNVQAADAGNYSVVLTNLGGSVPSTPVKLTVNSGAAPASATHAVLGGGYVAGGTVTVTNTITYTGTLSALAWTSTLPTGWTYASGGGSEGEVKPAVGANGAVNWSWTTIPASPFTFTYTLNVPAGANTAQTLSALVKPQQSGSSFQVAVLPDPLSITPVPHSADSDGNFALSLSELTRVIALYNTRNGTLRTGRYAVATTATEDGFTPDATTANSATVTLPRYHSADTTPRDGKLTLNELTRVIELFNVRTGNIRTGAYRVQSGTEDGFAPAP